MTTTLVYDPTKAWNGTACVSAPATPTGLTATPNACGSGSITISWTASANATSYTLQDNGVTIYSGSATSFTQSGLVNGSSHSYTVSATNVAGTSVASGAVSTTAPAACVTAPATPTGLSVSPSTCGNYWLNLSWNASVNATGYKVERDGNGTWIDVGNVTAWSDTGLAAGSNHSYRVLAYNSAGSSAASVSVSNTVSSACVTAPATPTGLSVTPSTCGNTWLNLSWNASTNATGYKYERDGSGTWIDVGNVLFVSDTGLALGSSHSYKVLAYNGAGSSAASGSVSNTVASACSSSAPTVTVQAPTSVTGTTATLNGTITSIGSSNATVRGFTWGTNANLSGGDTATTTESGSFSTGAFTNSSQIFVANTTYYVRAYATNGSGTGYSSIVSFVTSTANLRSENFLPASGGSYSSGQSVSFTAEVWNRGVAGNPSPSFFHDAFSYQWNSTSGAWTQLGSDIVEGSLLASTGHRTDTSASLTLSQTGTLYVMHCVDTTNIVTESNETDNCSGSSPSVISFTVSGPATPPTVTIQATNPIGQTTATLNGNITATGGATPTVRGFAWGTSPNLTTGTATTTESGTFATGAYTTTLSSLAVGTQYYARAYATNSAGTGYSGLTSFTTTVGPCGAAPILTLTAPSRVKSGTPFNVTWTVSGGVQNNCTLTEKNLATNNSTLLVNFAANSCTVSPPGSTVTNRTISTQTTYTVQCDNTSLTKVVNILPIFQVF